MKFSAPSTALALTLLGLTAAQAQTSADTPPSTAPDKADTQLQKVEVVGSQDQYDARRFDTATKIVVTQEEIAKFGDATLADVLKRQPGITVSGGNAGRGGGEIRMRGLGSGYTQILLNGEPAPPGFTLDSLSPSLIERIEIMRAASAEFSTQAIAGTINIVLKTKVLAAQRDLKATVEGSNVFQATNVNLQVSDKAQRLSYTLTANLRWGTFNHDSTQTDAGTDAAGTQALLRHAANHNDGRFASLSLSPRLIWTTAGGDTLTSQTFLNLNHSHSSNSTDWTAQLGALPLYPVDRTQPRDSFDLFRTDLNWVAKFADGAKLDSKLGWNLNRRDSEYPEQTYDLAHNGFLDENTLSSAHNRALTLVSKYSTPFTDTHTLATGVDVSSNQRIETRLEQGLLIPTQTPIFSDENFHASLSRLAWFAQDEWNITPKWSLYLGVRWEAIHTVSAGNTFDTIRNRSSVLSPVLQVLWKLPDSKNDQLRFALTRTYKAPGLNRLIPRRYTSIDNSAVSPDFQGNPDLKPELATGLDLAFEHFIDGGATFSASAYARRISDFTHDSLTLVGDRWLSMPVNDGRAQTHGLELEAKFPLQLFYPGAPAIDVRANLASNSSTVSNVPGPNNRLADQTPLSCNFGLDYKWSGSFNVGGNFAYKTGGPIRISSASSSFSSIKREMDVYALWKLDTKNQVRVSAVNVLAQPYTSVSQFVGSTGSLRSSTVHPFSAILRATWEMKI